jgi:hypothetical protein
MRPWMSSRHHRDLTDAQWAILDTLIPEPTPRRAPNLELHNIVTLGVCA